MIRLQDGSSLDSGVIARVRGHAYDPLSVDELWQKFGDCTQRTHSRQEARALFDMLQAVEKLSSPLDLPTCKSIVDDALSPVPVPLAGSGQ